MQNIYEDKETGLTIRRINHDSKDEVFTDIRVMEDCFLLRKSLNIQSILPENIILFEEIGQSHRLSHQKKNFEVYAVLNKIGIITTCGVIIENGFPYMHTGTLKEYENRYADVTNALARMLKQDFKKVFYLHLIGMDKKGLKLKEFVGYYPDEHQAEVWEMDV